MPNIFSGLFSNKGGGSASAKLAQYKQQLEDYQDEKDAYEQHESNLGTSAALQRMIDGFGPERQGMTEYFKQQLRYPASFDQGQLGVNKMASQRGAMVQASAAEAEDLQAKKDFHDYKNEFPTLTDWQKNIKMFHDLGDDTGILTKEQIEALKTKRGEQFLKQEDQFISTWDPNKVISARLLEGGITKALIPEYSSRLNEFFQTVDAAEDTLNFTQNRRDDIQKLYADSNLWTTGPGSMLQIWKFGEAADWERLKLTVVSNIGLDKIMELKAGSKQGATGLGALNEQELIMLQNHAGNLDAATNPTEVKRILRRLDRDLKMMQTKRMRGLSREKTFYNKYKQYLPYGSEEIYVPPPELEHMFTGGDFERPFIESPLDEEKDLDTLLDQYAPQTGQ